MDRMLDKTVRLMRYCNLGTGELAERSGVPFEWLKKFRAGKIKDPGVRVIQKLYDFLMLHREARGKDLPALPELPPPEKPERRASAL